MYQSDIPFSEAHAASYGTSFVPERRAEQRRNEYAETLQEDLATLTGYANTEEKLAALTEEFERYRAGYRARYLVCLRAASRTLSPMITGSSNFPVARNRKRLDCEMKRWEELTGYRERALKAIRRTLCPELAPVMAGDSDAVERLKAKIVKAEAEQARMKAINAAHKKFLKNSASLDASDLSDEVKEVIRSYKPHYSWEPHPYPPYAMTNNNGNIRRMKERLESISRAKVTEEKVTEGTNARIEDNAADNRIRLFFPGKPAAEVRTKLKGNGFRWTPSLGCWQAYRNYRTLEMAAEVAGKAGA